MAVSNLSLEDVVAMVESEGYALDKRPGKLNVVGIRDAKDTQASTFDDALAFFTYDDYGNLVGKVAQATTSPGLYWLQNPMSGDGAAILKGGQYLDTYAIGMHRGKYEALTQQKPVTVMRDNDRDGVLNYFAPTVTGLYGINIHKSSGNDQIDRDSAGCQVFRYVSDFDEMMNMARASRLKYGNTFTYTLIDQKDIISRRINYGVIGAIILGLTAYGYFVYRKLNKN